MSTSVSNANARPDAQHRGESILVALLVAAPFVFVARLPPNPGFWGQWACLGVALLLLAVRLPRARGLPASAAVFPVLAAVLVAQFAIGLAPVPAANLVVIAVLIVAALLAVVANAAAAEGRDEALADAFAWGLLAGLVLNALVVGAGWLGYEVQALRVFRVPPPPRALGLIGQPNHLGVLAAMSFFAALHLRGARKLAPALAALLLLLSAIICAATISRVALLVWFVGLLLWFAWQRGAQGQPSRRLAVVGALAFIALQALWLHFHGKADAEGGVGLARSDAGRLEMLADALALWREHPLLGVGQGNLAAARLHELSTPAPAPNADHAHNLIAQALAEWGLVGALAVTAGVIYALWLVASRLWDARRTPGQLLACVWITGLLAHSLVEHPLWFAHFLLPFGFMLGLLPQCLWFRRAAPTAPSPRAAVAAAAAGVAAAMALVAWDYQRLQTLALKMLVELDRPAGTPALVSFADVAEVERMTLFPLNAKIMLSRKIPLGESAIDAKIELARQAMDAIPTGETVARYGAFAAVGGRDADAREVLGRFARRSPAPYARAHDLLASWQGADARVQRLFASLPAPVAASAPARAASAASSPQTRP